MTDAQKAKYEKMKALRAKLANLTDEEKERIRSNFIVVTVEGHTLSPHNTIMLYFQSQSLLKAPSVVAGYQQWKRAGRQVRKGEHGLAIWIPTARKVETPDGEETETNFICGSVFDIQQTEATQ